MEELQAATKGKVMKLSSACGLKKHGSFVSLNTLTDLTNSPDGDECVANIDNVRQKEEAGSVYKDTYTKQVERSNEDVTKHYKRSSPPKEKVQDAISSDMKYKISLPQIDELSMKSLGPDQTKMKIILSSRNSFKTEDSSNDDEDFTMVDKDDVRSYRSRSSEESNSSSLEREYYIIKEEDIESGNKNNNKESENQVEFENKAIEVKSQSEESTGEVDQVTNTIITNKAYKTKSIEDIDVDMADLLENLKKIKTSSPRDIFTKDKSPIIEEPKVEHIIPIIRTFSEPFIQEISDDASDSGRSGGSHPPIIQEVESEEDTRSEDTMKYREESADEMDSLEIEARTPVPHILEEEDEDANEVWDKENKLSDHELTEFELAEQELLKQELAEKELLKKELYVEISREEFDEDEDYGDYELEDDGSSTDPGFDLLTPIEENSEPTTSASKSASCKTSSDETTSSSEKLEMKQHSSSCHNVSNLASSLSEDTRSQTFPRSKIETEAMPFSNPYYPLEPREVDPELFFQLHTVDSQEELQEFLLLESQCHTHDGKDGGLSAAFVKPKKSKDNSTRSGSSSQSSHSSLSSTKSSRSRSTNEKSSIPLLISPASNKTAIPKLVKAVVATSTKVQYPGTTSQLPSSPNSLSPKPVRSAKVSSITSSSSRIRSPKPRSSAYTRSSTSRK